MATADEMLATVVEDQYITVDLVTRIMTIPSSIQNLGVESDDDVLRLPFKVPRYFGEFDLSEFTVRINYLNAKKQGDLFEPDDVSAGDDYITFTWLVGRYAAAYKGNVSFNVCLKKYDTDDPTIVIKEFNSTIAILPVLEGLETAEAVIAAYADILEAWKTELFGIYNDIERAVNDYINSLPDSPVTSVNGKNGVVTLVPSDIGAADEVHTHESVTLSEVTLKPFGYSDDTYNQMGVAFAKSGQLLGQLYFNIDDPNSPKMSFRSADGVTAYHTVYTDLNRPNSLFKDAVTIMPFVNVQTGYNNYGVQANYGSSMFRWWFKDTEPNVPNAHFQDADGTNYYHKLYSNLNKPKPADIGAAVVIQKTAVLSSSDWSDSVPYTQTISVSDVLVTDKPKIDAYVYSDDAVETALSRYESWSYVNRIVSGDGTLTAYCYEYKPTMNIPINIEIVR